MKGYDALADTLVAEGVEVAFNVPDEVTVHVVQSLVERDVRVVRPRHEQNALAMADGYSRACDKVGVCLIGPGPALAHTGTGLVTGARHGSKLLALVGSPPRCAATSRPSMRSGSRTRWACGRFHPATEYGR
jgi:acetolactate synthase-1/2/3 large subunit